MKAIPRPDDQEIEKRVTFVNGQAYNAKADWLTDWNIVVIDVETICFHGERPALSLLNVPDIIQCGITVLNIDTDKISEPVTYNIQTDSEITPFCTKLTGVTAAMSKSGISFKELCSILSNKYKIRNRMWGGFGNYDKDVFMFLCEKYGIKYPFNPCHIDIKSMFMVKYRDPIGDLYMDAKQIGVTFDKLNMHTGGEDSHIAAKLLSRMI